MSSRVPPSRGLRDYGDELKASIAASRELGPEMSDAVAARLLRDIERAIDEKIEAGLAAQERKHRAGKWLQALTVAGSTTAMVPITAVAVSAGGFEGFLGGFVAWLTILILDLIIVMKS